MTLFSFFCFSYQSQREENMNIWSLDIFESFGCADIASRIITIISHKDSMEKISQRQLTMREWLALATFLRQELCRVISPTVSQGVSDPWISLPRAGVAKVPMCQGIRGTMRHVPAANLTVPRSARWQKLLALLLGPRSCEIGVYTCC